MIDAPDATSTRPYLIRALYEWCTDNGFTPYVAVAVDDTVKVPPEYVKDGEIVLNIGFDATSSLKLGNDFIEFKARFSGTAREIMVPINQVMAIYARENGQGMAFPLLPPQGTQSAPTPPGNLNSVPNFLHDTAAEVKTPQLTSVESSPRHNEPSHEPEPPRPVPTGPRPKLKRVK